MQKTDVEGHAPHAAGSRRPGSLLELISAAYYLNLDTAVERRNWMEKQMSALKAHTGLAYQRFPAINGTADPSIQAKIHELNGTAKRNWTRADVELEATPLVQWPGVLGSRMTHITTWQHAVQEAFVQNQTVPFALIFERRCQLRVSSIG